ncbi:hypothetical protein Pla175_50970 [Pirellulimonas nuda]|uniref:IgA FC receptor n=1 Tax=Pirellulimonas nuda TaxID=2528009 RepID=A0A518DJL2_9BACT|nr:hypothetical protein [Pirellulimonas nuda]QDU91667.1 hypothetical protein Pla175_50970 [Pirellulimonas nuda]
MPLHRTIRLAACLAVALPLSAEAGGHHPPDRLTPPPCSAEGGCVPNRTDYGYYPGRWRRWPGDYDEAFPTPAGTAEESALPTVEPIAPEVEDRQAPPPSESKEEPETSDDAGSGGEMELPPLPGLPGLPGMPGPGPGAGSGDAPAPPSGGSNPPPRLPFGPPAGFGNPPGASGGGTPAGGAPPAGGGGVGFPRQGSRDRSDDLPPALPQFGRAASYGSGNISPVVFLNQGR